MAFRRSWSWRFIKASVVVLAGVAATYQWNSWFSFVILPLAVTIASWILLVPLSEDRTRSQQYTYYLVPYILTLAGGPCIGAVTSLLMMTAPLAPPVDVGICYYRVLANDLAVNPGHDTLLAAARSDGRIDYREYLAFQRDVRRMEDQAIVSAVLSSPNKVSAVGEVAAIPTLPLCRTTPAQRSGAAIRWAS